MQFVIRNMQSCHLSGKICLVLIIFFLAGCNFYPREKKVLVFYKTMGFVHPSISDGVEAIMALGKQNGFLVDTTGDASFFVEEKLREYGSVIFLNTTGDVLDHYQQADFERYIQAGGGFVGIHAAADTEYDWPWYNQLVGAYFDGHPSEQNAKLQVTDSIHPATKGLEVIWERFDEWYNYKSIVPGINVLITIDEDSYEGGTHGQKEHPMAWYREYDGGRSFYTGLGHTKESYSEPLFLQHLLGGINYAIGENRRDYSQAWSDRVPKENRFFRQVLASNLEEPMELEYLPEGRILFIERKGDVLIYDLNTESLSVVSHLDVQHEPGEDGLLGLAIDPEFEKNGWIYLYYTPDDGGNSQKLSRFDFREGIDLSSEKVLLEIPSSRDCCHSGGSIEFGPGGLLYLSTGDDTNPFESAGYSPSDERPDRETWDAQKSSANTNDLRGKIIRIKPEPDGTYSIPDGNLFVDDDPLTRPEIYVMGLRNPFRISVDMETGILYWGDVGPDAGKDNPKRGPKGHDELNQARFAGNWGWPYTRGNNKAYWDFDFETDISSGPFDPEDLINNSPNNTGIQQLPPAQPSFIWYPYDESVEFPWTGEGGRNAMAGPVFHKEDFAGLENSFPDYFDDKLFFYDWMRDWIFIITMNDGHDYIKSEPFMPEAEFHNPVDMVFGKDGNLYLLEYGESWRKRNPDAQLNRIEYIKGNRAPIARITADRIIGANPLNVKFSAKGSIDFEEDDLTFEWNFGDEAGWHKGEEIEYRFDSIGNFLVTLRVTDDNGSSHQAKQEIVVGNDAPVITIEMESTNLYYTNRTGLGYSVEVSDKEDGSLSSGDISEADVFVTLSYLPEGMDQTMATMGHQPMILKGKVLIDKSDCPSCHAINEKINGPSYRDIANRYSKDDLQYLSNKVLEGGSGVWGETPMAAHPQLSEDDVNEMVKYIMTLGDKTEPTIPVRGELSFDKHKTGNVTGAYILTVTYTDKGRMTAPSISSREQMIIGAPILQADKADYKHEDLSRWDAAGAEVVGNVKNGTFFGFKDVSWTKLRSVTLRSFFGANYVYGGKVELRKGSVEGEVLASSVISVTKEREGFETHNFNFSKQEGVNDLFLVFTNEDADQVIANPDYIYLDYDL